MNRPGPGGAPEIRALLVLDQLPGVGPRRARAIVERFGSAVSGLAASADSFATVAGRQASVARTDPEYAHRVDAGLADATRYGMTVLGWGDPTYPEALLRLADPPPVLFLRGRMSLLNRPGVAVVGARRSTERARSVARALGRRLASARACVVSGMALGVDAEAHRGALESEGDTVAVVGRGADAAYPRSHRRLFDRIVETGLLVSEFLPGTPPLPHHFPRRNRIMAALARTVVVVEAGRRSGSLITVEHALDLGRDVWSVPGPIDQQACEGSNRLLEEGALPLVSIERFVSEMIEAGVAGSTGSVPDARDANAVSARSEPELRLLGTLADGPMHIDELAERARVDVALALALLVRLELEGAVEQMPGSRFRAA